MIHLDEEDESCRARTIGIHILDAQIVWLDRLKIFMLLKVSEIVLNCFESLWLPLEIPGKA